MAINASNNPYSCSQNSSNAPVNSLQPVHLSYTNTISLLTNQANQIEGYLYRVEDSSGFNDAIYGLLYLEYLGTVNGDITDYKIINNNTSPASPPTQNTYQDNDQMVLDYTNQNIGFFQYVQDARTPLEVSNGDEAYPSYYEYLGLNNNNITDYRKLSQQEAQQLVVTPFNQLTIKQITTDNIDYTEAVSGISFVYNQDNNFIDYVIFNPVFSKYLLNYKDYIVNHNLVLQIWNTTEGKAIALNITDLDFTNSTEVYIKAIVDQTVTIADINLADIVVVDVSVTGGLIEKEKPLVFVFTGQSNMNGIVDGVNTGGDKDVNPNVTVWNDAVNDWVVADLYLYPFGQRNSINGNDISGNNNLAFHTAKRLQERTGRKVQILFAAYSGQAVNRWVATDSNPFAWVGVTDIITASGVDKIDAIFWHQGEANSLSNLSEVYASGLKTVITQFQQLPQASETTPFIASELAEQYRLNTIFYSFPEYVKHINNKFFTVIQAKDLSTIDNVHFTGENLVTMSYRYADAFAGLPVDMNTDILRKENIQYINSTGATIYNSTDLLFVDNTDEVSKNIFLPDIGFYKKITIKTTGSDNVFTRITGDAFADGAYTYLNFYGNSSIDVISTPEGHKVVRLDYSELSDVNSIDTTALTFVNGNTGDLDYSVSNGRLIFRGTFNTTGSSSNSIIGNLPIGARPSESRTKVFHGAGTLKLTFLTNGNITKTTDSTETFDVDLEITLNLA